MACAFLLLCNCQTTGIYTQVCECHFAWTENIRYDKLILIMGYFTQLRIAARIARIFL